MEGKREEKVKDLVAGGGGAVTGLRYLAGCGILTRWSPRAGIMYRSSRAHPVDVTEGSFTWLGTSSTDFVRLNTLAG
jgi:hypothetical protein